MNNERWIAKWKEPRTPIWQLKHYNPVLRHIQDPAGNVFVPLCGATLDILWFAHQVAVTQVVGVEVSKDAIEAFFRKNGLQRDVEVFKRPKKRSPEECFGSRQPQKVSKRDVILKDIIRDDDCASDDNEDLKRKRTNVSEIICHVNHKLNIRIYQCDIFDPDLVQILERRKFDIIFDRGALYSLYTEDRPKYCNMLLNLLQKVEDDENLPLILDSQDKLQLAALRKKRVEFEIASVAKKPVSPFSVHARDNLRSFSSMASTYAPMSDATSPASLASDLHSSYMQNCNSPSSLSSYYNPASHHSGNSSMMQVPGLTNGPSHNKVLAVAQPPSSCAMVSAVAEPKSSYNPFPDDDDDMEVIDEESSKEDGKIPAELIQEELIERQLRKPALYLIGIEYAQGAIMGPPFIISETEVDSLFVHNSRA